MSSNYSPKKILEDIREINFYEINNHKYAIAKITDGRIFTNRDCNISVIFNEELVPHVSWQCKNRKIAPDIENFSLTGEVQINHPPKIIQKTVISLLTGSGGNYNYFHWLYDSLPRLYLIQNILSLDDEVIYYIPEDTHYFQGETLTVLGINSSSCISSKDIQHIQAKSIIATSHPNPNPSILPKWIYSFLRKSFLTNTADSPQKFIYISRVDSSNSRRLINEAKLIEALHPLGFQVYKLSEFSFLEQIALFSKSKMIVGVHGAGLTNLTFASKGAIIYELFSERYQPNMYERISQLGELNYNKIICESYNTLQPDAMSDLFISDDAISKIVNHTRKLMV